MIRARRNVFVSGMFLLLVSAGVVALVGVSVAAIRPTGLVKPTDSGGGGGTNPGVDPNAMQDVLIQIPQPYTDMVGAVEATGGKVTRQYQHFNGIAAKIPRSAIATLSPLVAPGAISKDLYNPIPGAEDRHVDGAGGLVAELHATEILSEGSEVIAAEDLAAFAAANPDAYLVNNATTNVGTLHAAGFGGQGVVVAVLDTGIRPGFPHLSLDNSVIGCEDFVGDVVGCSNSANDGHGTFVAGMISANVIFQFNTTSTFFRATQAYLPAAISPPNRIPMIGSAPLSSIYALRACAGGCFTSAILSAVDRAIDLREKFDNGQPGGVKIQVLNMSLGGPTLFAGNDIFDTAVDALLDHDIVVTCSSGNSGPSGLTSGSPSSSHSSISVGAASIAGYERIVRDLQFGFGIGGNYRPTTHIQTASFSSRGPYADGRRAPDVLASGDWSYGQGLSGGVNTVGFAGGTSFSSPNVAGIAAVLRQKYPAATAREVRNAIIASANPGLLGDNSGPFEQGNGFVNATAADALLAAGPVPDPPAQVPPSKSVKSNVINIAGLPVANGTVNQSVGPLVPGQKGEIIYDVTPNTKTVTITIANFVASNPPSGQNIFFGDEIFLTVHVAKTSRQPGSTGYYFSTFTTGGTFVINNPEVGLLRISVNGDWRNKGNVSADVSIVPLVDSSPQVTEQGKIRQGDILVRNINVPVGTASAEFRLYWREGWEHYPTNDIDMILVDPDGMSNTAGATLSDPERVVIANPKPGNWTVRMIGFQVPSIDDKYELRVSLDGNVVH
jgi:hypothetical protein